MKIIGITGGVGSGKTSIIEYIKKKYHCTIFMADEIGRKVQQYGDIAYEPLCQLLGDAYINPDKSLNREKMAQLLYADALMKKKVEDIVHPAVKQVITEGIEREREKGAEYVFIEAALLIEAGYMDILDELWYIFTSEAIRTQRLKQDRGYSEDKTKAIIDAQLSEEEYKKHADVIIENNKELTDTYRRIDELMGESKWRA